MVRNKKGSLFIWVLLGSLLAAAPVLGEEPAVEAAPETETRAAVTTPEAHKAMEIPQIDVLAHKEKAATSTASSPRRRSARGHT